jgi:hypothetical protein
MPEDHVNDRSGCRDVAVRITEAVLEFQLISHATNSAAIDRIHRFGVTGFSRQPARDEHPHRYARAHNGRESMLAVNEIAAIVKRNTLMRRDPVAGAHIDFVSAHVDSRRLRFATLRARYLFASAGSISSNLTLISPFGFWFCFFMLPFFVAG